MVKKKELEPQYYMSATNTPVLNYKVYYMSMLEKILYFLAAFIVGGAVGYLFYGGIAKDDLGQATTATHVINMIMIVLVGSIAGKLFLPIRTKQIIGKRRKRLTAQFRDMLEGLATSLGAGKNVVDSFHAVYSDLKLQYEEEAFILKELEVVLSSIANNIDIEDVLLDFGQRSGIGDIESFANVFKISYRKGGNIKDTIRNTYDILSQKMAISEEIETMVTGSKTEQSIMVFMPIAIIGVIKLMSPDFAQKFVTPSGIAATTVAILMFVGAYYLGKVLLDIKI